MNQKKSSSPAPASASDDRAPTHEQITARAHRIWIEAGRPEGRDREHWEEAERQLSVGGQKQRDETTREIEADKRVDGLTPPSRDPRTPKGEAL